MIVKGLHSKQKEIATEILNSDAKIHSINSSRQAGKTFLIASKNVFDRILGTSGIGSILVSKKESKPYEITLASGSILKFRSADRSDSIRGGSYKIVISDEFSFFKEGVFNKVIRPTTNAKKDSKIIVASTPKGKNNDFYKLIEQAQEGNPNYKYYFMMYTDNPYYDLEEVEDARLRLPGDIFRQEYLGEFITDGGVVFDIIKRLVDNYYYSSIVGERYYAGIDWGRVQDRTVLTIINSKRDVVFMKKWQGSDWDIIVKEVANELKVFNPYVTLAESNGIGDPLIDAVQKLYLNVTPFITSIQSKREIIENLRYCMVTGSIGIPNDKVEPDLYIEMEDYTFTISKSGLISYHHKPGKHDDLIDSLALANEAYAKNTFNFNAKSMPKQNKFHNTDKII